MNNDATTLSTRDKVLFGLDEGPFGAAYRVLLGFAAVPAMRLLTEPDADDWSLPLFLLLLLTMLRAGTTVARKVLPSSPELREAWSVRRRTAKLYDSYQWAKLTWVGVGLGLYTAVSGHHSPIPIGLSLFCLIAGMVAMMRWRAVASDSRFPKPAARRLRSRHGMAVVG